MRYIKSARLTDIYMKDSSAEHVGISMSETPRHMSSMYYLLTGFAPTGFCRNSRQIPTQSGLQKI